MAHEILWNKSLYDPPVLRYEPGDDDSDYDDYNPNDPFAFEPQMVPDVPLPKVVSIHTYQHDMESLWWLALWISMCMVGHAASSIAAGHVFRDIGAPMQKRSNIFLHHFEFVELIRNCIIELYPIGNALGDMRILLVHHYQTREPSAIDKDVSYGKVLAGFVDFFRKIKQTEAVWGPVKIASTGPKLVPKAVHDTSDLGRPSSRLVPMPIFALEGKGSSKRKPDFRLDEESASHSEASTSESSGDEYLPGRKATSSSKRRKVNRGRGRSKL